jgi:dTDP-4-amino-4,6-dideoxygalactose transaminase
LFPFADTNIRPFQREVRRDTDRVPAGILSLPMYPGLRYDEQSQIVQRVLEFVFLGPNAERLPLVSRVSPA